MYYSVHAILIFDADGLIKLYRSGTLPLIVRSFTYYIPEAVYQEVVVQGKARFYSDADAIDEVLDGYVDIVSNTSKEDSSINTPRFGAGEQAALNLYLRDKIGTIVSDDRSFLSWLSAQDIPFLVPSALIVAMARLGTMSTDDARKALETIRPYVRLETYQQAVSDLPGEMERNENKVVPLRIPENLLELVTLCSEDQRTDKSTTLRQWLYKSAEEFVLHLIEEGRISASRGAELLEISIYDIYRLAEEKNIRVGATKQQHNESLKSIPNPQE